MRELLRLYNQVRQQIFRTKLLSWLFWFVIPIMLGTLIMRPNLKAEKNHIPGDSNTPSTVEIKNPDEFATRRAISEALFGKSILLKWDKYCLFNNNDVSVNGNIIKLPFQADPEAGAMELTIDYGDYKSKIYASVGEKKCLPVKREDKNISITFRRPSEKTFDFIFKSLQTNPDGGILELEKSTYIITENSFYTRKQYRGELIFKYIAVILAWMILMVNFKEAGKFFRK